MPLGDFDKSGGTAVDPGMYDAIIESAHVLYENGLPKVNDNGKNLIDVMFVLDTETKLRRRYTISFGQNSQTKAYAAFAKVIEAALGIRAGDPAQKAVEEESFAGQRVRIVVETNDRGYSDIVTVMPPATKSTPRPTPKPQPVPANALETEPIDEAAWESLRR